MPSAPLSQTLLITNDSQFAQPTAAVTIPVGPVTAPTLATLSLSTALQSGTAVSGTILGATNGSVITANIPGIAINSALRTYTGTPTGGEQTIANGLVETLAGANGSPKPSPITIAAAAVVPVSNYAFTTIDVSLVEGDSGTKLFGYNIARTVVTTGASSIDWSIAGRGANPTNTADFGAMSGTVTFAAGATSGTANVLVTGDTAVEPDEGFTITLSNPLPAGTISVASATGTIINDDTAGGGSDTGPVATTYPIISGTAAIGATISRALAVWNTGVGVGNWYNDAGPISGQNGETYVVRPDDGNGFVYWGEQNGTTFVQSNGIAIGAPLSIVFDATSRGWLDRTDGKGWNGMTLDQNGELNFKDVWPELAGAMVTGDMNSLRSTANGAMVNRNNAAVSVVIDALAPNFKISQDSSPFPDGRPSLDFNYQDESNRFEVEVGDTYYSLHRYVAGIRQDNGYLSGMSKGVYALDTLERSGTSLFVQINSLPRQGFQLPQDGIQTNKVAFRFPPGYSAINSGRLLAATAPMQITGTSIDDLGHLVINGVYSGFLPNNIQAKILTVHGELYQNFAVVPSTIGGGTFTATTAELIGRAIALVGTTARLQVKAGNNAYVVPWSMVIPDHIEAVPFDKMLGTNGGFSVNISDEWEFVTAHLPNDTWQGLPNFADPVDVGAIKWSTDGLNGTVQRDQRNGIGKNTLGIVEYNYRLAIALPTLTHAYVDWGPGVVVGQHYGGIPGFAHNSTTGRTTFDYPANQRVEFDVIVNVSGAAPGAIMHPVVKDAAATGVSPYAAAYLPVAKGIRFLDFAKANNPGNYTRTLTALPVRTVDNRLLLGDYEDQTAVLRATGVSAAYPISKLIDGPELVTAMAAHYAANTPNVTRIFWGTSNEQFNDSFSQRPDAWLAGVRAGYAVAGVTKSTAVPETIIDCQFPYIFPQPMVNCTSDGTPSGGDQYLKCLQAFKAGDKIFRNVGGGINVYQFTQDVPAGYIFDKALPSANPNVFLKYDSNACGMAGSRWYGELVARNSDLVKAAYSSAGRPAPEVVLEGFSEDFNISVPMLDWNNNYLKIDRVSQAPYFNNGGNGGGGFMDWNDSTIWDATAKTLIANNDLAGALDHVFDNFLTRGIDLVVAKALNWTRQLRAYCLSKGLAPDAIKGIFYEFGDHNGFSGYNWPDNAKALAFIQMFWSDQRSYTLFLHYLRGIGQCGVPGFLYAFGPGNRPFCLVSSSSDTTSSNHYYTAMKDMQSEIAALP